MDGVAYPLTPSSITAPCYSMDPFVTSYLPSDPRAEWSGRPCRKGQFAGLFKGAHAPSWSTHLPPFFVKARLVRLSISSIQPSSI